MLTPFEVSFSFSGVTAAIICQSSWDDANAMKPRTEGYLEMYVLRKAIKWMWNIMLILVATSDARLKRFSVTYEGTYMKN